jgi:hypothetical protein
MDALAGLEEISEQTSCRVDAGTRPRQTKCKSGHGVAANLTHAKVAREKKKVLREPRPPGTGKSSAPAAVPVRAKLGRSFSSYRVQFETCRARALEFALSRAEIDRIGGFTAEYSGKLLSQGGAKDSKRLGAVSLELMLK